MSKNKTVSYISKNNKKYDIKKRKTLNLKAWVFILLIPAIVVVLLSVVLIVMSSSVNNTNVFVSYYVNSQKPSYKAYLRDNDQFDKSYLDESYALVGNLVNTINPEFRFQFGADDIMDLTYSYKINAKLLITKSDEKLKDDDYVLASESNKKVKSSSFSINENLVIDYYKYNEIVNNFKRVNGMTVDGSLIVTFDVTVGGEYNGSKIDNKSYRHQITIPLSEQTIKPVIDTDAISDEGYIGANVAFNVDNPFVFIIGVTLLIMGLLSVILAIYLFVVFRKKNIYSITLKKLMTEYDRLIVNGVVKGKGFDEKNYDKIIEVHNFSEMVDAASNLNANILFYEVIPGEECYFILTNDDIMYKFKLTKAYLQGAKERGELGY